MLASLFLSRFFSREYDSIGSRVRRRVRRRVLWLVAVTLLLFPVSAFAQCTSTWNGGTGSWDVAGNWTPVGVPTSASNTCINAASSAVTINGNDATSTLTLGTGTDSLAIANAEVLTMSGSTISNAGAISLNSTGNATELLIGASNVTLSGAGTLTLGNNANNFIFGSSSSNVLTNQSTIQGSGNIGDGQMALSNSGTIDANQSVPLTLQISNGATNTGTLEATSGGTLVITGGTYTNTGGTIQAGTSSTVQFINGVTISGGTITQSGGTIEFPTSTTSTIDAEILNPANSGQVKIDNAAVVTMGAGSSISNAGNITMNSTGNATELVIGTSNVTLSGTGTFTMSNNAANFILGSASTNMLTNQSTIQGAGNIGDGQMALNNSGTIDANQSNALTLQISNGATNTGTLEATSGGTLILNGGTYTNTGGIITNNASTLEFEGGATINGGTVSQTGAGTLELAGGTINATITNSSTGTIEAVTSTSSTIGGTLTNPLGGKVQIQNAGVLITGTGSSISNAGTMTMNSTGNATEFVIGAANVTLSGTGTLTLGNNANNFIFGSSSSNVLTNQSTIQGSGNIGDGQMALSNSGTIDANQSVPLTLQISNGATNTGTLEATSGGTLVITGGTYTNTGGTIQAGTSSTVQFINGVTISGGTITQSGGTIEFPTSTTSTIDAEILNPANSGQVKIDNAAVVTMGAGSSISNAGNITMNSTGNATELVIGTSNVTLSGTGTFTMSNNTQNYILGSASANQLTNQSTVQGAGNIGDGEMALNNSGTIDANQSNALTLQISNGATNTGTLEATSGGTLIFNGGTYTNTGGIITNNASTLEFEGGATINGGTVSQTGAGTLKLAGGTINTTIANSSTGTIEAVTSTSSAIGGTLTNPAGGQVQIQNAGVLTMGSGSSISNAGTMTMNSTGNTTELLIGASNVTLSGTGTFTMSNNANNYIFGTVSTNQLTNASTIQGSGQIGFGQMALSNSGTIDADQSVPLILQISSGATNTGKLEATSGATLTLNGGTYANAGGTILATGANSNVLLESNVTITGGTLTGTSGGVFTNQSATLSGLTISAGTINIPNATVLNLLGTITNKGTINLESTGNTTELNIGSGSVTLAGTGKVILSANANNYILGTGTLTNQNTIEGEGNIGDGEMGLINSGTIEANETGTHTPSTLLIDTGAAGFTNNVGTKNGVLNVSAKNTIIIEGGPFTNMNTTNGTLTGGSYIVAGELEFAAGSTGITTNDALITLTGATAKIFNTTTSSSALTGISSNGSKGSFTVNALTFTTAGNFTNGGTLGVGSGGKFAVGTNGADDLTNFSSGTLTGGTYILTATGQLQFNNGGFTDDIVTNDANITLAGVDTTKPSIIDQNGGNALAFFATNEGNFTLTTDRNFTTGGSLTNTGTVDIQKSTGSGTTALIIGSSGNYTQTGGTTTVDGKLTTAGAINITGGFLYGNLGTLTGNLDLTGGTINPGDGIKKIGVLNITGTYAESGAGILNIDLDGSTVGKFDVLNVSGAATLSGELNVDALTGFTLAAGDSFDIMNYSSETGTFTTTNLPALTGGDTWNINYAGNGGTELILTVEPPVAPAAKGTVSGAPATRVSRSAGAVTSTTTHEPSAILAKATCFGSRLFGSESCGRETAATVASVGEVHAASGGGVVHNNFMVATHSISAARGTASRETAVSASAMAKLYVCAYIPASVGHTMGCN
jgi:fibronectin-binding autotransporter adhesin